MINWIIPEVEEEKEEIERTAIALDLDFDDLYSDTENGKLTVLTDDIWEKLDNTDSWNIESLQQAKELAEEYEKNIDAIIEGFISENISMPAPIVLKYSEEDYYLIAGNTRLMVAKAFKVRPKVWLVEHNQSREQEEEILLEAVNNQAIVDSIKNRNVVFLYYKGKNPGGDGYRTVEPVCLGYNKKNRLVLRVWDMAGSSHTDYTGTQPLPGWRLLRVDRIGSYAPSKEKFNTVRPGFNRNSDRSMSRVIINAKFGFIGRAGQALKGLGQKLGLVRPDLTESKIYKDLFGE
jgi:hypothetical protein